MRGQAVFVFAMVPIVLLVVGISSVQAVVLYDGSLGGGNQTPANQGWLYGTDPLFGASATQSASAGVTTLDTTPDISDSAGYFSEFLGITHPSMPVLDHLGNGYTVRFSVQIVSETHNSNDRAGFSLIALSSDSVGVEIAFWENEIWAQLDSPLFTHGEGTAFDATAGLVQYDLAIQDDSYNLYTGGSNILQGALKDYSSHIHPVYSMTDFLFFGDDTSSAAGVSELAYIEVIDYAVPEPATFLLLGFGAIALRKRRG